MKPDGERIATLEANYENLHAIVVDTSKDVKEILAKQNQQEGKATILGLVWTGVVGLIGAGLGFKVGH